MIRALCEYYDNLRKQPNTDLIPLGYSSVRVKYNLVLKKDGSIGKILHYGDDEEADNAGEKTSNKKGSDVIFPLRKSVSTISSEIIDHRGKYIFGLEYDDKAGQFTDKNLKAFEKCKEVNIAFLEDIHNDVAEAYKKFMLSWVPQEHLNEPELLKLGKEFSTATFIITIEGGESIPLNRTAEVLEKWDSLYAASAYSEEDVYGQCSITGKFGPIAKLHDKIKKFPNSAMDTSIVSFNKESFTSYGKTSSYNSSVSVEAMRKYTAALNYLLSSKRPHTQQIGTTLILFWANTTNYEVPYLGIIGPIVGNTNGSSSQEQEEAIQQVLKKAISGKLANIQEIDPNVDFYVLAIKKVDRLGIRLFEKNKFGNIIQNLARNCDDMSFSEDDRQLSIAKIVKELQPTSKRDERAKDEDYDDTGLQMKLLSSILTGAPYPRTVLVSLVRRIKTDRDVISKNNNRKVKAMSYSRMRIIRACLIRNKKIEQGGYKMLNENSTDAAYNLGRLFAALEKAQQDALGGNINATIKDKFFSSACSTPNLVFPRLLKLAQTHIAKLGTGAAIYYDKLIQEILGKISDGFPRTLNTEKQGMFILGYYQQKNKFYEKNTDKGEE